MNSHDTAMGGSHRMFESTLWTTVLRARDASAPGCGEALSHLIRTYWKPAYLFLRRQGHSVEQSKGLIQGFFAALMEKDALRYVRPDQGKFRTFLLSALKDFVADERDRERAWKRGGRSSQFSIDAAEAEQELALPAAPDETPERTFDRAWALEVLERALRTLRSRFEAEGRGDEFVALRLHLTASVERPPSYAEIARTLDASVADVRSKIHRARQRYRETILDEIRSCCGSEEDAQEEIRGLFTALAQP